MKHAVGTHIEVTNFQDHPEFVGLQGYIIRIDTEEYFVRLEDGSDQGMCAFVRFADVKLVKKPLQSAMEQYGRILLPLLHGSHDALKLVYYSSTTGSVYMMDKMMNTDQYFEVCVVKMLWDRDLQGRNPNTLATEVFRLKQPRSMLETLALFCTFMAARVNGKDYSEMLWQEG